MFTSWSPVVRYTQPVSCQDEERKESAYVNVLEQMGELVTSCQWAFLRELDGLTDAGEGDLNERARAIRTFNGAAGSVRNRTNALQIPSTQ
jgi:hypothetical protein